MPIRFSPLPAAGLTVAIALFTAASAFAQPNPPLGSSVFAFPGWYSEAASGVSAGRSLADRWLGSDPATNPAISSSRWGVELTPVLLHSSRQDLRAANTDFDETSAFFDLSGLTLSGPLWKVGGQHLDLALYAHRALARSENNAFVTGRNLDPTALNSTIASETAARENLAGAGLAFGPASLRLGVAGEWVMRDDEYTLEVESGDPSSGIRITSFDGTSFAVRGGVKVASGTPGPGHWDAGASVRYASALEVEGTEHVELITGTGDTEVRAERAAGYEYGGSVAWQGTEVLKLFAGAGGRGEREWEGFGVVEGSAFEWAVALEYHDAADPWTARFGGGADRQSDAAEDRATRLALGLGWTLGERQSLEFGVLRRVVHRGDAPNSFDDRVMVSIRVGY
ncbi:MAG: hypothetical protein HOP12_00265 [Candidatus Eisenbacteria bacterium]|uniref:DUF560 domain-containing protein n=1 Tax=Eiseniibacteriota bacterium TaxID=2212470 RepID=A0A849SJ58_UNCEI|nr:hypothetical protein [Candidatus Eisenbacteria bacterium]